jgi:hypothetical protein
VFVGRPGRCRVRRDAARQGLLERLGRLQDESQGLAASLAAERRRGVELQQELGLMAASRNTWRVSAGVCVCVCVCVGGGGDRGGNW